MVVFLFIDYIFERFKWWKFCFKDGAKEFLRPNQSDGWSIKYPIVCLMKNIFLINVPIGIYVWNFSYVTMFNKRKHQTRGSGSAISDHKRQNPCVSRPVPKTSCLPDLLLTQQLLPSYLSTPRMIKLSTNPK